VADPKNENGFIQVPNELAEALAKVNLSAYETRVLWALIRKTWGWRKNADHISITEFQKLTGLKRRHTQRALARLISRKIVTCIGYSFINKYSIQKDYSKWKTVTQIGYSKSRNLNRLQLAPKEVTETVTYLGYYKRNNKDNIQKTNISPSPSASALPSGKRGVSKSKPEVKKKNHSPGPGESTLTLSEKQSAIQRLVNFWKTEIKEVPLEDKAWDKLNFARYCRSAKAILEYTNSESEAKRAMREIAQELEEKGLSYTLETIVKRLSDWKQNQEEIDKIPEIVVTEQEIARQTELEKEIKEEREEFQRWERKLGLKSGSSKNWIVWMNQEAREAFQEWLKTHPGGNCAEFIKTTGRNPITAKCEAK